MDYTEVLLTTRKCSRLYRYCALRRRVVDHYCVVDYTEVLLTTRKCSRQCIGIVHYVEELWTMGVMDHISIVDHICSGVIHCGVVGHGYGSDRIQRR